MISVFSRSAKIIFVVFVIFLAHASLRFIRFLPICSTWYQSCETQMYVTIIQWEVRFVNCFYQSRIAKSLVLVTGEFAETTGQPKRQAGSCHKALQTFWTYLIGTTVLCWEIGMFWHRFVLTRPSVLMNVMKPDFGLIALPPHSRQKVLACALFPCEQGNFTHAKRKSTTEVLCPHGAYAFFRDNHSA